MVLHIVTFQSFFSAVAVWQFTSVLWVTRDLSPSPQTTGDILVYLGSVEVKWEVLGLGGMNVTGWKNNSQTQCADDLKKKMCYDKHQNKTSNKE